MLDVAAAWFSIEGTAKPFVAPAVGQPVSVIRFEIFLKLATSDENLLSSAKRRELLCLCCNPRTGTRCSNTSVEIRMGVGCNVIACLTKAGIVQNSNECVNCNHWSKISGTRISIVPRVRTLSIVRERRRSCQQRWIHSQFLN